MRVLLVLGAALAGREAAEPASRLDPRVLQRWLDKVGMPSKGRDLVKTYRELDGDGDGLSLAELAAEMARRAGGRRSDPTATEEAQAGEERHEKEEVQAAEETGPDAWRSWARKDTSLGRGAYGEAFSAIVTNAARVPKELEGLGEDDKVVLKVFHDTDADARYSTRQESALVSRYIEGLQSLPRESKDSLLVEGRQSLMTILANFTATQNLMVYEYCPGKTLTRLLPRLKISRSMNRDHPEVAANRFAAIVLVVRQLLAGVYVLSDLPEGSEHTLALMHRDIKPPNIQVELGSPGSWGEIDLEHLKEPGTVKLLDPGLVVDSSQLGVMQRNSSGIEKFTPYDSPHKDYFYAPPEVNLGSYDFPVYDPKRPYTFDVFSVGTNFLAMLTGNVYPSRNLLPLCKLGVPAMREPGHRYPIKREVASKQDYDNALASLPADLLVYKLPPAEHAASFPRRDVFVRGDDLVKWLKTASQSAQAFAGDAFDAAAFVQELFSMLHPEPDQRPSPSALVERIDAFYLSHGVSA